MRTASFKNPGPGQYKSSSFVDKYAAPKFGFGSSKREKDYLGLSKLSKSSVGGPGPGSYKIPSSVGKTPQYALPNRNLKYAYI